jgi:hypothetical protein
MGANQSTSPSSAVDATSNDANIERTTTSSQSNVDEKKIGSKTSKIKSAPKNESGYAKAERICRKKKRVYDACYTAALSSKEEDCEELFDTYRSCFLRVLTKDMEKRGVKVNSGSMLGEYQDEVS